MSGYLNEDARDLRRGQAAKRREVLARIHDKQLARDAAKQNLEAQGIYGATTQYIDEVADNLLASGDPWQWWPVADSDVAADTR